MSSTTKTSARPTAGGAKSSVKSSTKKAAKTAEPTEPTVPAEGTKFLKKHLIEKVARRSGLRKNEVRPVLDALLEEIGGNLEENAQMVLQPLGKIVVKQAKDAGGATIYTCKIRRSAEKSD